MPSHENLTVVTPPAVEPVSLADAKNHLRVSIPDDDALITALVGAARGYVESYLKMALVNRQYTLTLDYFPNRTVVTPTTAVIWDRWLNSTLYPYTSQSVVYLPNPPLVSVDLITYYDTTGTLQTMDFSEYVPLPGTPGRLTPAPGKQWVATQDRIGGVQITYTAGFGPDASMVPPQAVAAIKLLVGHWYVNREAVALGTIATEVPVAVNALLDSVKYGFYN